MRYLTLSVLACSLTAGLGLLAHAQPASKIAADQARALEALRQAERAQPPSHTPAKAKKKPAGKNKKQAPSLAQQHVFLPVFSLEDQERALRALRQVEHGQPAAAVVPHPSSPADDARALAALRQVEKNPALAQKPNRAVETQARKEEKARTTQPQSERETRRVAEKKARADKERAAAEARQRAEQDRNRTAARLKQAEQQEEAAKPSEGAVAATRQNAQAASGVHIELHKEMRLSRPPAAAAAKPGKAREDVAGRPEKLQKGTRPAQPAAATRALSIKEQKLADLLRRYRADEITPAQYHAERARIIAGP
jgi:colicin import membrane protein